MRDSRFPGRAVGFINLAVWPGKAGRPGECCTWSFFIDIGQQGKGLGRSAAALAARLLKSAGGRTVKLAVERDNVKAQRLYRSLGFAPLDELDGDDLVFGL